MVRCDWITVFCRVKLSKYDWVAQAEASSQEPVLTSSIHCYKSDLSWFQSNICKFCTGGFLSGIIPEFVAKTVAKLLQK